MSKICQWAITIAAVLVLAGCMTASNMPDGRVADNSIKCSGTTCRAPVGYQCFILCRVLVADEIVVQDTTRRFANTLVWELPADSALHFAANGIVFEDPGFRCGPQSGTDRAQVAGEGYLRWQCTNNGRPGRFKYTVTLEWHGVPVRHDPWVFNP